MSAPAFPGVAPNWLDQYTQIQSNGSTLTQRHGLNVIDAPIVGATNPADDSANDSSDLYLPGSSTSLALPATGAIAVPPAQAVCGVIQLTGTLTGGLTIVLPVSQGRTWVLDFQSVAFAGHTIVLEANGNNWGTGITAGNVYRVTYTGSKLWGETLTA